MPSGSADPVRPDPKQVLDAPARAALVRLLLDAEGPLGAPELAAAAGLHITTVRHHLDVLLRSGFIAAASEPAQTRGRPKLVYTAVRTSPATGDAYVRLAAVLAERLSGGTGDSRDGLFGLDGADGDTVSQIVEGARETGFDPEVRIRPATGETTVLLHSCPYREVASQHPEVVCGLHRAVVEALESRSGGKQLTLIPSEGTGICRIAINNAEG